MNKIAVLGDIHFPFHEPIMLQDTMEILKIEKPDCIVLGGDILDFPGLSKYEQEPNFNKTTVRENIELCADFLEQLRKQHPNTQIDYTEGNHEFRFKSYPIRLAPELFDFMDLTRELDLGVLEINWFGVRSGATKFCDTYSDIDDTKIGHFEKIAKDSCNTVRAIMRDKGTGNYVQNHIHRAGIMWFTDINKKRYFGVENPCLCKLPHYMSQNNWQRGFTIIDRTQWGLIPRQIVY